MASPDNGPKLVKAHNLQAVRRCLFTLGAATRQELSQATGISTVTLGTLLRELIQAGQVMEAEATLPTSGRPARVYRFNGDLRHGLLVSVENRDGRRLNAARIDLYGRVLWEESLPARGMNAAATAAFFQELMTDGRIGAVSIGLPGIGFGEYLSGGRSTQELSLEALSQLEAETGVPFTVENDVNLMAAGYAHRHHLPSEEAMAYLYLMRGIYGGSAVWLGKAIHHGKNRFAGELLAPPYSENWSQADRLPREELLRALERLALPYLSILAPHRLVLASDYLDDSCLEALRQAAATALWAGYQPEILFTEDPHADYEEGLKQAVLERLTRPILEP